MTSESDTTPVALTYMGRTRTTKGIRYAYTGGDYPPSAPLLFKTKLAPQHRIGEVWNCEITKTEDGATVSASRDYSTRAGQHPNESDILAWVVRDGAVQTEKQSESQASAEFRSVLDRHLAKLRDLYRRANRAERAAYIATLIKWLEE